ncbi:MAG: AAA family ATPase [Gemmatimonadetes bacterium]|nr:AAA family ATPase [Gemmatimonadota bacterium]
MRFRATRIDGYGSLTQRVFSDLDHPIVVVYGPNESGKTTFYHYLTTMLFGFHPANLEGNPYAPWSGVEMGGEAEVVLGKRERWTVKRAMRASITGRIVRNKERTNIQNQPLPCLGMITRALFQTVYAMNRHDLVFLDEKSWAEVKDRLLGTAGIPQVQSARLVAEALEKEADQLWRSDRRGKSRSRKLRDKMRALGEAEQKARERDRATRTIEAELERADRDLAACEETRAALAARIRRARRLLPASRRLMLLVEMNAKAEIARSCVHLPPDPMARREALLQRERELKERADRLARERGECRRAKDAFTDRDRTLLGASEETRRLRENRAERTAGVHTLDSRREDLAGAEAILSDRANGLFVGVVECAAAAELPREELSRRISTYREAREERIIRERTESIDPVAEGERENGGANGARLLRMARNPALAAAAGVLLFALYLLVRTHAASFLVLFAAALATFTAVQSLFARRRNIERRAEAERREKRAADRIEAARDKERAARDDVRALLDPVPLADHRADLLDEDLRRDLTEYNDQLSKVERLRGTIGALHAKILRYDEDAASMSAALGIEDVRGDRVAALDRRLDEARSRRTEAGKAEYRLGEIAADEASTSEERSRLAGERETLEGELTKLGPDPERGAMALHESRRAADSAEALRVELRKEAGSLSQLRAEVAAFLEEEPGADDNLLAQWEAEEKNLHEQINELHSTAASLRSDLKHRLEERTAADLAGEKAALGEELQEARRERDRKALLARIVREGEARYRREHEPDIYKRAGEHLSVITNGRYDRFSVEEGKSPRPMLHSHEAGEARTAAEPFSQGTLDQLYWSLRMALVDHLEAGGEPLPLFLDEVFAHWDAERMDRGIALLRSLAANRQIFFFTCHESVANRICDEGGAARIDLEDHGSKMALF